MRIDIISAVPELLNSFLDYSIVQRAKDKQLVEIEVHNLRDYAVNKHGKIDDMPYGGGAGMVLMIEPIAKCLEGLQKERTYDEIIYTTPEGEQFVQNTANYLSLQENIVILCGHYKGIDERVRDKFVTKEISLGDFVLSGGEIPAAMISDAIVRLLPKVLSDETSALTDSFQDGLLAPPVYTRPAEYEGMEVPPILLSGHTANVEKWRYEESLRRTEKRRPELL
jgi:tRNA (guanine37-N1)-methyltransferase